MNKNKHFRNDASEDVIELGEDVIELGLVSSETKGGTILGNEGLGFAGEVGISE